MHVVLRFGHRGEDVKILQASLQRTGFRPGLQDGIFGPATLAALLGFQRSNGLLADGVVGPKTWQALGLPADDLDDQIHPKQALARQITVQAVAQMFPYTRLDSIKEHLPAIKRALIANDLMEKPMVLVALATIRAETELFEPISEMPSRYNSSPGGHLFDLYDNRRDLGNQGSPDGEAYKGRGFIQLTGRANYGAIGRYLGMGKELLKNPDRCNESEVAAQILAAFISMRRVAIKRAVTDSDLRQVRRLINGGSHGLERFIDAFRIGDAIIGDDVWPLLSLTMNGNQTSGTLQMN